MNNPNRSLSAEVRKAYNRKLLPGEDINDISSLSIHRIARVFSRERLLVHPRKWTARQLQLLRCVFTGNGNTQQPPGPRNEVAYKHFQSHGALESWSASEELSDGPPRKWGKELYGVFHDKTDSLPPSKRCNCTSFIITCFF